MSLILPMKLLTKTFHIIVYHSMVLDVTEQLIHLTRLAIHYTGYTAYMSYLTVPNPIT